MNKDKMDLKKKAVLECALGLFLENNMTTISMNDIAQKASVGRATLYRYFESRDEIIFTLAALMMEEISLVAFKDVTTKNIAQGYKNMILKFNELEHAYKYMAMFDAIYTDHYPNQKMIAAYREQFMKLTRGHLSQLHGSIIPRHIMVLNLVMDFLEDLAIHKTMIPKTQGITVEQLLEEFLPTIDAILGAN